MPGSTQLSDLPGGPPNNEGYDDDELLNDIIDEVNEADNNVGGHIARAGSADPGAGKPELEDYNPHHNPIRNLGNEYNPNIANPYRNVKQQYALPPQHKVKHIEEDGIIQMVTDQLKEPILVSLLVFMSGTKIFRNLLNRFLPNVLKLVDETTGQKTIIGAIAKSGIMGIVYYLINKFVFQKSSIINLI